MQAVLLREIGDPDVLRLEEVARPEPGEGEVLLRVRAVSVNPIDWKYRRFKRPVLGLNLGICKSACPMPYASRSPR